MKKRWLLFMILAIGALVVTGCGQAKTQDNTDKNTESGNAGQASTVQETGEEATRAGEEETSSEKTIAVIDVKDYGKITVELNASEAPLTVANFVELARSGFYDGLTFHRIMDGFMIQGGDPTGTGMGGSDQTIKGEFSSNGIENHISHVRGTISMARAQDPDSASSQFFIVQSDSDFLDGNYAGFGTVTDGMDVVDKICEDAEPTDDNGTIPGDKQPVITSITIQ